MTWPVLVQLLGLLLLAVGLGMWQPWCGVAVAGLGLILFGVAAEATRPQAGGEG